MRRTKLTLRSTIPLFALVALAAAPFWGPPRITVREVTGTPPTPGAVLVVEEHHHTDDAEMALSATAEGIREGRRVSSPIALTATAEKGHFGVTKQWDSGTAWVLVFTVQQGEKGKHGSASSLVKVNAQGRIVGIETTMDKNVRGDVYPRAATKEDIDAALAALTATR